MAELFKANEAYEKQKHFAGIYKLNEQNFVSTDSRNLFAKLGSIGHGLVLKK
jgi:hypothetical protein